MNRWYIVQSKWHLIGTLEIISYLLIHPPQWHSGHYVDIFWSILIKSSTWSETFECSGWVLVLMVGLFWRVAGSGPALQQRHTLAPQLFVHAEQDHRAGEQRQVQQQLPDRLLTHRGPIHQHKHSTYRTVRYRRVMMPPLFEMVQLFKIVNTHCCYSAELQISH